ncbi:MAG: hypothetical protein HC844_03605 [Tabrizicola sp.]|nr:hypothetical protein [Tabrizicola sp.]
MRLTALALSLLLAAPATAETLLSAVAGNWAGPSNTGAYFRAELSWTQGEEANRLRIWNSPDPSSAGELDFDNTAISLGAFARVQKLAVVDTADGSILEVITEFADEEAEGRVVMQLQYIDSRYKVVGYQFQELLYNEPEDPIPTECVLDLRNGTATVNGMPRDLPPLDSEAVNASGWDFSTAFKRGYCPRNN